jgi:hypothetical protein
MNVWGERLARVSAVLGNTKPRSVEIATTHNQGRATGGQNEHESESHRLRKTHLKHLPRGQACLD